MLLLGAAISAVAKPERCRLFLWSSRADFAGFESPGGVGPTGASRRMVSPTTQVPGGFDQLVVSWNTRTPPDTQAVIFAQVRAGGEWSRQFKIALWHGFDEAPQRTSFPGQEDAIAKLDVDTLLLKRSGDAFRVTIDLDPGPTPEAPELRLLAVQTLNTEVAPDTHRAEAAIRPMELPVPELSQLALPEGHAWCSPTCVAMVLRYWAKKLGREDLQAGMVEAARGIRDNARGSTGNWPFNTAFVAEFEGMAAHVDRFESVGQIAQWLAAGVPVIVSLDRNVLTRTKRGRMGHLVVARGIAANGDIILNDPWDPANEHKGIRVSYPRADFERAWLTGKGSRGTVYLIRPEGWKTVSRSD